MLTSIMFLKDITHKEKENNSWKKRIARLIILFNIDQYITGSGPSARDVCDEHDAYVN